MDAGTETNINLNHQIYYHVMGSDQSEDILCWKDPENPKHSLGASVTEDGKVSPSLPTSLNKTIFKCLFGSSFLLSMHLRHGCQNLHLSLQVL